ncbi:pectin methylesterase [Geopyxis carbonaria]|nr:pectin methylesterase [Geopyxis carbonaria]
MLALSILLCGLLPLAQALSGRAACQKPTKPALKGCAHGTIYVSPTDPSAHFTSIQSAVLSLPNDHSSHTILVGAGLYSEQVNITRPGPLYLLGQTSYSKSNTHNLASVQHADAVVNGNHWDNAFTSTLTIAPNLNASLTGSGPTGWPVLPDNPFGNTNFRAYNLNWANVYADYAAGQSLALSMGYANAGFYYNRFTSYQDTIFVGKLGNAYFYRNDIAGTVDFLYGFGTAFIAQTSLTLKNCGGGITAWKGANTTYENTFGVYIADSTVKAENKSMGIEGKCYLGRPWNGQHRSIFMNTYLDDSIQPAGYVNWIDRWGINTTMAEYKSYGPGWNQTGREATNGLSEIMTKEEVSKYDSPRKVFQNPKGKKDFGWVDWDP